MLKSINQHLIDANAKLELAAKEIAASRFEPVSRNLLGVGRALEQIFEIQYQIWALHPELLPEDLRRPAEDAEVALSLALRRAEDLSKCGALATAVAVLRLFTRYETSQSHIARANEAIQRLQSP